MTIKVNAKCQLDIPGEFQLDAMGRIEFPEPLGWVLLPRDYLEFMQRSDSVVMRDRDGWCMAQFPDGAHMFEVAWLSEMSNVMRKTRFEYQSYSDAPEPRLPPTFAIIGSSDDNRTRVLLGIKEHSPDYGKVFAWMASKDGWMEGNNTKGLGFIADSFTEFMNGLTDRARAVEGGS